MSLDVEQKHAGPENLGSIDDTGGFFILVERSGRRQSNSAEPCWIMLDQLDQTVTCDLVHPDLAVVGRVADLFLEQHAAMSIHSDVVEHIACLGPVQQAVDRSAEFRIGD